MSIKILDDAQNAMAARQPQNDTTNNVNNSEFGNIQKSKYEFGNGDKYLNTSQLLIKYGHSVEEYSVPTEDGYILTLIRVPGPGPPVLLMHGLLSSSDDFLTGGPDQALPYLLANASFDLWLGNARGNKYSRKHVTLSPEERLFWEFSWHEIGYYDLPAIIDFALAASNRSQLVYVGHSQGTTVFYVLCSERPEFNQKISFAFSLATVAYTWHIVSPIRIIFEPIQDLVIAVAYNTRFYELLPFNSFQFVTSVLCDLSASTRLVCTSILFTIFGFDYEQINLQQMSTQLAHFPAGSSLKQFIHYLQLARSKRFAQYDHGKNRNLKVYGSPVPPSYFVGNVTVPISIFYATNDLLSRFEDVKILTGQLPRVVDVYRVPFWKFNHFDYLWAKDVKNLVNLRILKMIKKTF